MNANEINWTPFTEPTDWMAGVDPDTGLAGLLVRTLRVIDIKNELLSVALTKLAEQEKELAAGRRRNQRLVDEFREFRARVARKVAA